jgi:quinoprotein glucose dehydrogenase
MRLLSLLRFSVLAVSVTTIQAADRADWPNPGNDKAGTRYAALDQINRENVKNLAVAWTYHTGDAGPGTTIECTPLVIGGVMYVTTVRSKVVALDAATGKPVWTYDPYTDTSRKFIKASGGVNRGAAFWSDGKAGGQRRVILGVSDGRIISLDAASGKPDPSFGNGGELDLRIGLVEAQGQPYGPTSPPMVFEDTVIVGCSTGERSPSAPGDPRAFDVRTGKEMWRFHTVPRDGEFGRDTWPAGGEPWKGRGGANPWGGFTLDVETGILFCGTGSATSDFYGADRIGANLFANCVLALDARTGKRVWHFQTTRHDLWDHDNPCPPVLVTVKYDGEPRKAVAQLTKTGFCWLLDRATGKPLFGMREVPAAKSDVPGEQSWPTQPEPLKPPPLAKLSFTKDDVTNISPEAREFVLAKLDVLRHGERYTPPSERGSIIIPGFHGGATWSGASVDPSRAILFVNTNNTPYVMQLVDRGQKRGFEPTGYQYLLDNDGYPGIKPPWGLLTAIDLNTGEFAWKVTLGEFPELKAKGIPQTGTENFGGTIVTAGGLVFIGGTKDEKFHAFDASNGKLLWDYKLPAGGYATPCTYMVNGKQYITIAAGGGGKLRTQSGDAFVTFALP